MLFRIAKGARDVYKKPIVDVPIIGTIDRQWIVDNVFTSAVGFGSTPVIGKGFFAGLGKLLGKRYGLISPTSFFGNLTYKQAGKLLTKKFGVPRGSGPYNRAFFDPRTKRTFNLHRDPAHRGGMPHVDIRRRGSKKTNVYFLKP